VIIIYCSSTLEEIFVVAKMFENSAFHVIFFSPFIHTRAQLFSQIIYITILTRYCAENVGIIKSLRFENSVLQFYFVTLILPLMSDISSNAKQAKNRK
jgi:hypothetical protein